jgi:hypothetical protein
MNMGGSKSPLAPMAQQTVSNVSAFLKAADYPKLCLAFGIKELEKVSAQLKIHFYRR